MAAVRRAKKNKKWYQNSTLVGAAVLLAITATGLGLIYGTLVAPLPNIQIFPVQVEAPLVVIFETPTSTFPTATSTPNR